MYYIDQKYLLLVSSQLKLFKKKNDGLYNFRCPYCGDSKKSQTKARGFMFRKENSMIYKCHNCGVGASFKNFLKHVDSKIYNEYILERYKKKEVEPDITQFRKPRFLLGDSPLKSLIKVSTLEHHHPVKKFLENRDALTFVRVLGAGANTLGSHFTETERLGTVQNGGFAITSSAEPSPGKFEYGLTQFICADHDIATNEVQQQRQAVRRAHYHPELEVDTQWARGGLRK